MTKLRHLRYFVGIVDAGSLSRAAQTLFVAQPTLSQQMTELEDDLGVPLLLRSVRGVKPTPAGEALYREASRILQSIERLRDVVRFVGGEAGGQVSFGVTSSLAPVLASVLMAACNASLPKVTLRFTTDDSAALSGRVVHGEIDLAIVLGDATDSALLAAPLFRQRLYLVDRKRPGRRPRSVDIGRLAEMPLVLPPALNATRVVIDQAFEGAGLAPRVVTEANILWAILSAVQSGIGAAILPFGDLSALNGYEGFVSTPIEPPLFQTALLVSARAAPLTPAAQAVQMLVHDTIADLLSRRQVPSMEACLPLVETEP